MLQYVYILFLSLFTYSFSSNYFCNFKCGSKHTVCKREPCGPDPRCGTGARALPLDQRSRHVILDVHNKLRNRIALGLDLNGGNSKSSNMHALSYDKELEFVAQCWSNACPPLDKPHDECRMTKKFPHVGQNMFGKSVFGLTFRDGSSFFQNDSHLIDAVNAWYGEIQDVTPDVINSFHSTGALIGHFTQLLWASTTHVGCGRTLADRGTKVFIYCNYGPAGNWIGNSVYKRGQPCSDCGSMKCNSKYAGLCGYDKSSDSWIPPIGTHSSAVQISLVKISMYAILHIGVVDIFSFI